MNCEIVGTVHLSRAELLEAVENHLKAKSETLREGFTFSFLDAAKNEGAEIVFRRKVEIPK